MSLCGHSPVFRRDVCRSCFRKLGSAGLPMGPDGRTTQATRDVHSAQQTAANLSRASQERLDALASKLTREARERLLIALTLAGKG